MLLEEIKDLFNYKLRKAISENKVLKEGTLLKCDDEYFEVDWCGLEINDLWDELDLEDEFNDDMSKEEIEVIIDNSLKWFNDNLMIYNPTMFDDCGMSLGDNRHYEIVKSIPKRYFK